MTGKLYEPDGVTPAGGAVVEVWDKGGNSIEENGRIQEVAPVHVTQADANGQYNLEQIDPERHVIEMSDEYVHYMIRVLIQQFPCMMLCWLLEWRQR